MTENKIKVVLEIVNSKADVYGNRYFAIRATRTSDGASAVGKVPHGSNARSAIIDIVGDWENFIYIEKVIAIRDFNWLTKNFPYIGCTGEEISQNILKQWDGGK